MVGYRPGSGEPTEAILRRAATAPKSQALDALRDVLGAYAIAPLSVAVDGKRAASEPLPPDAGPAIGRLLVPDPERFLVGFDALFDEMLGYVVELNRRAVEDLGLNVLVFPEGTRSVRLSKGHDGLAQITQHLGAPILPVGCNGSDRLYPGNLPFSKGGRVVYRIGAPLAVDGPELAAQRVPRDVLPFTKQAAQKHGARYAAITAIVMQHIDALLDPPYRHAPDAAPAGSEGLARFV